MGLVVLTYHALDESGSVTSTPPAWFERTVKALAGAGWTCWDLEAWAASGRPQLDRAVAFAFDDGLVSVKRAADALVRQGWPATLFLVAGRMGGENDFPGQWPSVPRERLLGWSDLDDLTAAGFRFGSHGQTHADLRGLPVGDVERELAASQALIEAHTGASCRSLAYPYGGSSPRVREAARARFDWAFGTRLGTANAQEDVHRLSRVDSYYLRDKSGLDRLVSGRFERWLAARRALRSLRPGR